MHRFRLTRLFTWLVLLMAPLAVASSSAYIVHASLYKGSPANALPDYGITTPVATTGCGKPAPIATGKSANEVLYSGGLARSYRLHIPLWYLSSRSTPLILSFHGHGSNAGNQERLTKFSTLADQ